MTELKDLPRWLPKRDAMKEFAFSEDRLRQLRKENKINFVMEGNQFIYETQSLIAYREEAIVRNNAEEEENEVAQLLKEVLKKESEAERRDAEQAGVKGLLTKKFPWSEAGKTGRCRQNCGKGFVIIEDPLKTGKSYRLEYRTKEGETKYVRMDKKTIKDRNDAFKEYLRLRAKLAEGGEAEIDKENFTLTEFAPIFYGHEEFCHRFNLHLQPFFGNKRLTDIRFSHAVDYVEFRRKEGVADATIINELSTLRSMFNVAKEREYFFKENPIKVGRLGLKPNARTRGLKGRELDAILEKMDKARDQLMRDIVIFALSTALRRKNVAYFKKEWIDFDEGDYGILFIPGKFIKTRNDFPLPLNEELREILKRNIDQHPDCEYVFAHFYRGKWIPYEESGVNKRFQYYAEQAGVKDVTFHDLRRTAARRFFVACGRDLLTTSKFTGHKDLGILRDYLGEDIAKEELKEGMEKIGTGKK